MVDFIRGNALKHSDFTNVIAKQDRYTLKTQVCGNKQSEEYPICSDILNIYLKATERNGTIENSLHKYWNIISGEEEQNYNDFSFCDIISALNSLEKKMEYSLKDIKLTCLEFGFNIKVDKDPTDLLKENILMHKFKPPCVNPQNEKKKKHKKFEYEEYVVKIYNKSLQYNIKDKFILRVEVKYKPHKTLAKFGIHTMDDLRKREVYELLMEDFLKKFEQLLIVDSFDGNKNMSPKEQNMMMKYSHPNYWIELRKQEKNGKRGVVYREQQKCKAMIAEKGLDSWKKKIERLLLEKFLELFEEDCNCSKAKIVSLYKEELGIAS